MNLPEDSDPLEIDKISENFEVLDGAIKEQSKASGYQVGDTITTWRTDLGEEWLLCKSLFKIYQNAIPAHLFPLAGVDLT